MIKLSHFEAIVPPVTPRNVAFAFRSLDARLDLLNASIARAFGIGRTDLRAMEIVSRAGTVTGTHLAAALHLTMGSVSTLVDRLESAGYIRRTKDPEDRRRVLLTLTSKGQSRAAAVFAPFQRDLIGALGKYQPAELDILAGFLDGVGAAAGRAQRRLFELTGRTHAPRETLA